MQTMQGHMNHTYAHTFNVCAYVEHVLTLLASVPLSGNFVLTLTVLKAVSRVVCGVSCFEAFVLRAERAIGRPLIPYDMDRGVAQVFS